MYFLAQNVLIYQEVEILTLHLLGRMVRRREVLSLKKAILNVSMLVQQFHVGCSIRGLRTPCLKGLP